MKVSVPAPPRPMTGDLALVGPATEGPSRDVQERRREPDPHPLTAGRAGGLEPEALLNTLAAMPDLRAQGAPGEPREAILDLAGDSGGAGHTWLDVVRGGTECRGHRRERGPWPAISRPGVPGWCGSAGLHVPPFGDSPLRRVRSLASIGTELDIHVK